MDYRDRLYQIFNGKGPKSLRIIFDCDSTEWTMVTIEKKVYFLQEMIASGYPLESWIKDYKDQYKDTHPHILKCINKSIEIIKGKMTSIKIVDFLEKNSIDVDKQLDKYADFKGLDLNPLSFLGYKYQNDERKLDFIDDLRGFLTKENIHDENYQVKFWIINKWGGISTFKDNHEKLNSMTNRSKIDNFIESIEARKELTKPLFEVISSLSKVASFYNNKEYFVYDSRVIYAINWLLLKSDGMVEKYFPMPQGRNAKLSFFDLDTLIRIKNKDSIVGLDTKHLYYGYKDAYYIYCDLIKSLANKIMPTRKAYHMEMLLFSITNEIFTDLRKSVSINISKTCSNP